jgi:hypothetical protein
VFRSVTRFFARAPEQLDLHLHSPPRDAAELLARLRELGLADIDRCRLTRNRTVMVSFRGRELRVHEGYLTAPPEVLAAIVTFVCGRTAAARRAARARILAHRVERFPRARRSEPTRPEDAPIVRKLTEWHDRLNARHFGATLRPITMRISRRMRARLGHYMSATPAGEAAEIVISRRHIRRHGWEEALHTLLHEMVHQWQDETGRAIDHGPTFRAKAREVGITPSARRTVTPVRARRERATTDRTPSHAQHVSLKAAREE